MVRKPGQSPATASGLLLVGVVVGQLYTVKASADEVCRFAGTTDYAGHVAVTTGVAATAGVTKVDVAVRFEATTILWFHIHYLIEEVSTWQAGELESLAVNNRYFVGNDIIRQQWDEFQRGADGLQARRVQGKTLAEFRRRYPDFVQHWDPATFGRPWLHDYQSTSPERRSDLDLRGSPLPAGLRTPLAMAFYWVRWLPRGGQDVPVFLPGFKSERLVKLGIAAASSGGGMLWRAPLRYSALSEKPASIAAAWTSPDGYLLKLAFELHAPFGTARGLIHQEGCEGAPVVPDERRR
jgi:hypothetical protein